MVAIINSPFPPLLQLSMTEIQSLGVFVLTCLDLREYLVHTSGMTDTSFSSEVSLDTSYYIVSWCGLEKYPLNSLPKELFMPPPGLTEQYACQERILSGFRLSILGQN